MSVTADFVLFAADDCPLCGQIGSMIVPNLDADGEDDSERVCLDCGSALFVDPAAGPVLRSA